VLAIIVDNLDAGELRLGSGYTVFRRRSWLNDNVRRDT
jgi:hypothetical protein